MTDQRGRSGGGPSASFDGFADVLALPKAPAVAPFGGGTVERRSIAEQVSNRILGLIKSGNLRAGDKLPTEQQMCVAFGISRPPLREALKALMLMGVLECRQGGRYTVTDLSPGRLIAPINAMLAVADFDPHAHYEARTVVDLALVRLCTERATLDERRRLMQFAVDGRAFHADPVAFRLMDIEFHQAVNDGARNHLLSALSQTLYDVGLDIRRVASATPGVIETSVGQHIEIAEAVLEGNARTAVTAFRRHLAHVRDTTLQSRGPIRA